MRVEKKLHELYGHKGLYILLRLQMEAASAKNNHIPISKKIDRYAKDWRVEEQDIRKVIVLCRDNGILSVIQVKSATFLEFAEEYVIPDHQEKLRHSLKERESNIRKAIPADSNDVFLYFKELGVPEQDARLESYQFWDYWTERGWKRKAGSIKDWQATARRWIRNLDNQKSKEVWL